MNDSDTKPENTIPITLYVEKINFRPGLDRRKKEHVVDIELTPENMVLIVKEIQARDNVPGSMRIRLYGKLVL